MRLKTQCSRRGTATQAISHNIEKPRHAVHVDGDMVLALHEEEGLQKNTCP